MAKISRLVAREIIDSRGNPTIEIDAISTTGVMARAAVPSGASTGSFEALELRDSDHKRYKGKGLLKAISNVAEISAKLKDKEIKSIGEIDSLLRELDGTPQKSRLGGNTTIGVSLAVTKLLALESGKPLHGYLGNGTTLPIPMLNIINGGVHADNDLDFQEFMITPHGFSSFRDAIRAASEIFQTLKTILKSKGHNTNVGDEGGFAPQIGTPELAIELILEAITKAGYRAGVHVSVSIDCAANEFYSEGKYVVNSKALEPEQLIRMYEKLIKSYPVVSIEDPFNEEDWASWSAFTKAAGDKIIIIGDDLYVTNIERLKKGVTQKASNAILIKPNQIGTASETIQTVKFAEENGFFRVISHRSGETEDSTIAHMAVGLGIPAIKTGSICRGERTAKYNELLRIEESLGTNAKYSKLP